MSNNRSSGKVVRSVTKLPNIYFSSDKAIPEFAVWIGFAVRIPPKYLKILGSKSSSESLENSVWSTLTRLWV